MGNEGFSVSVAWPLLGTKSQVISASVSLINLKQVKEIHIKIAGVPL